MVDDPLFLIPWWPGGWWHQHVVGLADGLAGYHRQAADQPAHGTGESASRLQNNCHLQDRMAFINVIKYFKLFLAIFVIIFKYQLLIAK